MCAVRWCAAKLYVIQLGCVDVQMTGLDHILPYLKSQPLIILLQALGGSIGAEFVPRSIFIINASVHLKKYIYTVINQRYSFSSNANWVQGCFSTTCVFCVPKDIKDWKLYMWYIYLNSLHTCFAMVNNRLLNNYATELGGYLVIRW